MRDSARWPLILAAAAVCVAYLHAVGGAQGLALEFEVDDNSTCTVCPPASFANKNGTSNCTKLDREQICLAINGSCFPTPPNYNGQGYRPPGGNQTLCELCPANQYQDEAGQGSCKFCSAGMQPVASRLGCIACNAGEISNLAETGGLCTSCFQVHFGFIANEEMSECEPCIAGTMSTDGIECIDCPYGYYWDAEVGNCAMPCPRGHYCISSPISGVANKTYCSACPMCEIGKSQSRDGQYGCNECNAGQYQDTAGAAVCKSCEQGKYQFVTGMSYCNTCPQGFFCPNATSKEPCPADRYCPEGSTQPVTCNALYVAELTGCKPTPQLMGIVAGSVVGGSALVSLFIYRRYKQYSRAKHEESAALLRREENKHPVYSGL